MKIYIGTTTGMAFSKADVKSFLNIIGKDFSLKKRAGLIHETFPAIHLHEV